MHWTTMHNLYMTHSTNNFQIEILIPKGKFLEYLNKINTSMLIFETLLKQ